MPARQVSNPGTNGSNARYYTGDLSVGPDGRLVDDAGWHYDENGLSWDRPDSWVDGLPPANESESYSTYGPQPSVGGGGGGGYQSPGFQQAQAALAAQKAAASADRKASIRDLLISFGLVPEGFEDPYGDIDQTTKDLAAAKTTSGLSAVARMKEALANAMTSSSRNLSARGMRRSGDRGFQMRKNQLAYDRNYSDAVANLLGGARGIYSNFAQGEYGRQNQLAQSLMDMFRSRSYSSPYGPAPQPTPDPYTPPTYDHTPISAPYLSSPATTPWSPKPKERRSGI